MKVCPECQARFDGGEAFCPHDGSQLAAAREASGGELSGHALSDALSVEHLEFADALAERYAGRLNDGNKPVRVSVFNQGYALDPQRMAELGQAIDHLSPTLPAELLNLHAVQLDHDPPFLVEEAPCGESLRTVLDQRKALDWQVAVRLTCNIGRVLQYLSDRGVVHRGLHPQAIFVTDLKGGRVQLGEWAQDILCHRERPLELAEQDEDAFLGYTAYLAPEVIRDAADADEQSLVYAMGMLLYELIAGKPPFTSKTAAGTLERHLHEKPLKLSIAQGGAGLHPSLDDVLEMMWIKAPERRFQTPKAAIGALSSLLDESPDAVAPELAPSDKAVFAGAELARSDDAPDAGDAESDESAADEPSPAEIKPNKTIAGMPPVTITADDASSEEDGGEEGEEDPGEIEQASSEQDEPAETPSIIIDDPELRTAAEGDEDIDEGRQTEPVDEQPKKTLMMGAVDLEVQADDESVAADDDSDQSDAKQPEPSSNGGTQPMGSVDEGWDDVSDTLSEDEADQVESEESEEKCSDEGNDAPEEPETEADEDTPENEKAEDSHQTDEADETDEADRAEEDEAVEDEADEAGTSKAPATNVMEIGFMETENDGGGEFAEDWFTAGADKSWDRAQLSEHHDQSENLRKYLTAGIFALLALGSVGLYFFFETYQDEPAEQAVAEAEEDDEDAVDPQALRADFDRAFDKDQLIQPYRGSAVSFLELLEEHAPGEATYEEARAKFVSAATERAKQVEAEQVRYARDLAGYASQFAPDDEELAAYTESLHQRMLGDEEDEDEDEGNDKQAEEAAVKEKEKPRANKKPAQKQASAKKSSTTDDRRQDATKPAQRSAAAVLAEARAADKAGEKDKAMRLYREVISRSPSSYSAHAALGDLLFHKSAYAQALEHHREAARLRPSNKQYAISLGRTYFKLGRYQEAHDAWEGVLDRDPNNRVVQKYMTLVEDKL